jgi:hypothetical protein
MKASGVEHHVAIAAIRDALMYLWDEVPEPHRVPLLTRQACANLAIRVRDAGFELLGRKRGDILDRRGDPNEPLA